MNEQAQTARLEARVPDELLALLKRAADVEGMTVTDYLISAVRTAAYITLERSATIRLSQADQEAFADAILNPRPLAPALARAMERRRNLLGAD